MSAAAEIDQEVVAWAFAQQAELEQSGMRQLRLLSLDGKVWLKVTASKVSMRLVDQPGIGWVPLPDPGLDNPIDETEVPDA